LWRAMAEPPPPPNGGGEGTPRSASAALLEFAAAARTGTPQASEAIAEDLENIIGDVARTGVASSYPWEALRVLLARKVELVLGDFWHDVPDFPVQEGESFEHVAIEPLTRSLLEPHRSGAPFTVQRLCELLREPRVMYKSTRKYLYALQRVVVVTMPEEALAPRPAECVEKVVLATMSQEAPAHRSVEADAAGGLSNGAVTAGRKRKLSPELSNGVVSE